jgi:hypothetical protein
MGEGGGLGMRRGPFLGHRRLLPLHARGRQRWPERCREGGVADAAAGDRPSRPVGSASAKFVCSEGLLQEMGWVVRSIGGWIDL